MSNETVKPLAVVGIGALFPDAPDARSFWANIVNGRDSIIDVPPTHWLADDYYDPTDTKGDKVYTKRGGFLPDVPFDPMSFGIPPNTLAATDSAQLLSLVVARQTLDDATRGAASRLKPERTSVMLGATGAQELMIEMGARLQRPRWALAMRDHGVPEDRIEAICDRIASYFVPWQEATFPGLLGNVIAGRIANRFNLGGTNCVMDAACASSLAAVAAACNELWLGKADLVLTGGVDTMNDISMYMCFTKTPALSPSGDCRPFSESADGTILGEGLGMVALKRLEDAERDGDVIYAVLRGMGSSSDGRALSIYAPLAAGQAKAIRRAYDEAGYGPDTVELVEAHGTGTKAGDLAEFEGLRTVFGSEEPTATPWCALGTVKSQIGHTKSAAAAAGLLKVVLALHHKVLPPTIKVDKPNPKMKIDGSPFYLNTQTRPWVRDGAHPRRASVSSFGFGGSNFHLTLEEYTGNATQPGRFRTSPTELFVLGADTPAALAKAARDRGRELATQTLSRVAHASQLAFDVSRPARLAIVATDAADLARKLQTAATSIEAKPESAFTSPAGTHYGLGAVAGKVAFVFPGQGSQYVGMGADVALGFDEARSVWDEAAGVALDDTTKLHDLVFPPPVFTDEDREAQQRRLTATEWAQPALAAANGACFALLTKAGLVPDFLGGHSFGEISALEAAGVLDRVGTLRVARARGVAMRDASSDQGAMSAVKATAAELSPFLAAENGAVVIANYNAPKQLVISGRADAVARIEKQLEAREIVARRLPTAGAFHSPLVAGATVPFGEFLAGIPVSAARLSVIAGTDATPYPAAAGEVRARLRDQLALPVRFADLVASMYEAGARTFVEVGPGGVLSGLVEQCLEGKPFAAVNLDRKGQHGMTALWNALGRLAVLGHRVEFAGLWEGIELVPEAVPAPKFAVSLNGANYGRPYPVPAGKTPPPVLNKVNFDMQRQPEPARAAESPRSAPLPTEPAAPARERAMVQPAPIFAAPPAAPVAPVTLTANGGSVLAAAHDTFQQALASGHTAFMQTMASSFADLCSAFGASAGDSASLSNASALPSAHAVHAPVLPAFVAPVAPVAVERAEPRELRAPVAAPIAQPAAPAPARPVVVAASAAPAIDIVGVILEIVAAQTGYPREMLSMDMGLEADLGIDSIKRVEILSAVRERVPAIAGVAATEMAKLRTLGEIASFVQERAGTVASVTTAVASAPVHASNATEPSVDVVAIILEIVAAQTGYPHEMLSMEMALEADLGIDSIKRVEILSAVRERVPGIAGVAATDMAKLRTLGEIAGFVRDHAAPSAAANPAPAAHRAAAPSIDVVAIILEIVAAQTGYPHEMLSMEMALEADLGIDSIKRVEILSAVRERVPSIAGVAATEMAKLRTLGEIAGFVRDHAAPAPAASPRAAKAASVVAQAAAAPPVDVVAIILEIVAAQTGYPREMLSMEMSLEADLGIDSIKRVEILSAVRERVPSIAGVAATEMAKLRTLGEIAGFVQRHSSNGASANSAASVALPVEAASAPEPGVLRRAVVEIDAPSVARSMLTAVGKSPIVVHDAGSGVGTALVTKLRAAGYVAALAPAADPVAGEPAHVVYLGGLADVAGIAPALAIERDAFTVAQSAALALRERGGLFVTVQDLGGDFGLSGRAGDRAWLAGLAALAKTGAIEWPKARVRAIDIERAGRSAVAVADAIYAELTGGGPEVEVGLHADGRRTTLATRDEAASRAPLALPKGAVVVASGGARGVTGATLIQLARELGSKIALLGRTPLENELPITTSAKTEVELKQALLSDAQSRGERPRPAELGERARRILAVREIRDTLDAMKRAGAADVLYFAIDVRSETEVARAVAEVRAKWGPVDAIVHGAGVLADRLIDAKTPEQFDSVFGTKALGLCALLAATKSEPLRAICLFSSVAAREGNAGQVDYAMGNEVLNRVAATEKLRRGDACVVRSIGWGPWAGGMVTPSLQAHFATRGVALLGIDAGARAFVDELRSGASATEVVIGAELSGAAPTHSELSFTVDGTTHPHFKGHSINNEVVLPAVQVFDWFFRAASSHSPGRGVLAIEDLRVLRGVRLSHFSNGGDRFTVRSTTSSPSVLQLDLMDSDGTRRYSARATLEDLGAVRGEATPRVDDGATLEPYLRSIADMYASDLFHGPEFHVIDSIDGATADTLVATLKGSNEMGWLRTERWTDPAALDGGLQLAIVLGHLVTDKASLPTRIGWAKVYRRGQMPSPVKVHVRGHAEGPFRIAFDVLWTDAAGEPLVEFRGLEHHVLTQDTEDADKRHVV